VRIALSAQASAEAERNPDFGGDDDIFGQCDVQLRLAGVRFIRQGMGLEQAILSNTPIELPPPCGDQSFCEMSRVGILANQLLAAFDAQSGLPRGIHVVVGGAIWPGATLTAEMRMVLG